MPSERCLIVGSSDPSRDFRLSKVPLGVGTSGKPKEICSGVWGYPYIGSSDKSKKFRLSGVLTQVGTFDIPNRKSCSDLAFWIPIRTVPNSWETWKIRIGEVSYWDKTTPSIYMRGSWPIESPSIQSSNKSIYHLYSNPFALFSNPHDVHPLTR